jgi:hypothetical protein
MATEFKLVTPSDAVGARTQRGALSNKSTRLFTFLVNSDTRAPTVDSGLVS